MATTVPNLSPPMLLKFVSGPDIGILQREIVPMDGRLGGAASLLQERQSGETRTFVKKILGRKIAKPEVFPPNGLLFPTVPIQHER